MVGKVRILRFSSQEIPRFDLQFKSFELGGSAAYAGVMTIRVMVDSFAPVTLPFFGKDWPLPRMGEVFSYRVPLLPGGREVYGLVKDIIHEVDEDKPRADIEGADGKPARQFKLSITLVIRSGR